MERYTARALSLSLAFVAASVAISGPGGRVEAAEAVGFSPRPEHVIMIMLDGFRPDYLIMYDTPVLQELVSQGVWVADARSVFPSTTTTNQTSFVTGAYPATHGIPNNSQFDRELRRLKPGPLRDNRAVTIAEALAAAGLNSVSAGHFMLEGRGVKAYTAGNIDAAITLLELYRPNLLVYYNSRTDETGHTFGPFSAEMRQEVERADEEIGRLREAARRAGVLDETLWVIASDHGMSPQSEPAVTPSLGEVLTTAGFTYTQNANAVGPDTDIFWLQYGSAFLYLLPERFTPERYQVLLAALDRIEHALILDRETLARDFHADPEALGDVVVAPLPGYSIAGGSGQGGIHGRPAESQILLVFSGAGVKSGAVLPRASIVDIVPTVLALLDVPIPDTVDGQVLGEILARPFWKEYLVRAGGDLKPRDVAASGYNAANYPSFAADGESGTFWVSRVFATPAAYEPQYLMFDLGKPVTIGSIELVSRDFSEPVGPKSYELWIGEEESSLTLVSSGSLPALVGGESFNINLATAVQGRIVKLVFPEAHTRYVQLAEVRLWSTGRMPVTVGPRSEPGR